MKKCTKCSKTKRINEFYLNWRGNPGGTCKKCYIERQKTYEIDYKEVRKNRIEKNRSYILSYLQENCCEVCQEADIRTLEFAHKDRSTKYKGISDMIDENGLAKLKKEVAKCKILCANCHAKETHSENNSYRHQFALKSKV